MRVLLLAVAGLVAALPASGQDWWQAAPVSVRAAAMGGAPGIGSGLPSAVFANPASTSGADGMSGHVLVKRRQDTEASVAGDAGPFVVGLRGLSTSDRRAQSDLLIGGAYAREVFGFSVGMGAWFLDRLESGSRSRALRLDMGLTREIGPADVGLAVRGLGPSAWQDDLSPVPQLDRCVAVEGQVATGSAEVGPLDVALAGHLVLVDGDTASGAGMEIAYWPIQGRTFRILAGVAERFGRTLPTFGVSFSADDLTLEVAVGDYDGQTTHRIGLRIR